MMLLLACAAPWDGLWMWTFTPEEDTCARDEGGSDVTSSPVRIYATSRDRFALTADDEASPLLDRILVGEVQGDELLAGDEEGWTYEGDDCDLSATVMAWSAVLRHTEEGDLRGTVERTDVETREDCHGSNVEETCTSRYDIDGAWLRPGPDARPDQSASWGSPT